MDGNPGHLRGREEAHKPSVFELASEATVAQLDRALPSGDKGHMFESCRVRHFIAKARYKRKLTEVAPQQEYPN